MERQLPSLILFIVYAQSALAQTTNWPTQMDGYTPGPSVSQAEAVLPTNLVVTRPADDLAAEKARWSGTWIGAGCRDRLCDAKVVFENVHADGAILTFAFASATHSPIVVRAEAKFVGEELQSIPEQGHRLSYRFTKRGDLQFLYERSGLEWIGGGLKKKPDSIPRLPIELKGRFVFPSIDGREFSDSVVMRTNEQDDASRVSGTFSLYTRYAGRPEVLCHEAVNVPFSGRYDGQALAVRVRYSAKHSLCSDFTWILFRGEEHFLYWKSRNGGSTHIYLDP